MALQPKSLLVLLVATACAPTPVEVEDDDVRAAPCVPSAPPLDPRRSLAVTDLAILDARFSLQRVLEALQTSGGVALDARGLYAQWWDTNNVQSRAYLPGGPHCDDQLGAAGPELNGYPLACPRAEGVLADTQRHDPFCSGHGCNPYRPIGLFNRFDLADPGGADCGEYRLLFGKDPFLEGRNLLIFEGRLPNPIPGCAAACRPVAAFWANLSQIASPAQRALELERFFFQGIPGFPALVRWEHFTHGAGQVRTNQFMAGSPGQIWQLREYRVERDCPPGQPCRLLFRQGPVGANPFGELFDPRSTRPEAMAFQDPLQSGGLFAQLGLLTSPDAASWRLAVDDVFLGAQSTSQSFGPGPHRDSDYAFWFQQGGALGVALAAELAARGSSLTPGELVARAQTQSCAGCHQLSNHQALGEGIIWPPSLGFTHVSEITSESCGSGACWELSPALKDLFLPARQARLSQFLTVTSCPVACPIKH